jgi:hypothetical protein
MVPGGEMGLHIDAGLANIHTGVIDAAAMLQSQISLTTCPGGGGGTCLLPGFHHEIVAWTAQWPPPETEDTWAEHRGWQGRNANTAWPHAFDQDGRPLPEAERNRLKAGAAQRPYCHSTSPTLF